MKLQFDPTKVTRVALENAASIASMLLTTELTGRRSRAIGSDASRPDTYRDISIRIGPGGEIVWGGTETVNGRE